MDIAPFLVLVPQCCSVTSGLRVILIKRERASNKKNRDRVKKKEEAKRNKKKESSYQARQLVDGDEHIEVGFARLFTANS